ncbi:MAG: hypothetical protein HY291_07815 [Planctomycetes bacterium]|nr:hypothetical protein [Planctomycetota bacterium]
MKIAVSSLVCLIQLTSAVGISEEDANSKASIPAAASKENNSSEAVNDKERLERKASTVFEDCPCQEALSFLASKASISINLDPSLLDNKTPAINLNANALSVQEAIKRVLDQTKTGAKLWYVDGAYWVSKDDPGDVMAKPKPIPAIAEDWKEAVTKALLQLGDEAFEKRESAQQALMEIGPGAIPQVKIAACASGDDIERQSRARKILRDLRELLNCGELTLDSQKALKRKVSFCFVDTPMEEAVQFMNSLAGNSLNIIVEEELKEIPLGAMRFEGESGIELGLALRWFARTSGTRLVYSADTIKFVKRSD